MENLRVLLVDDEPLLLESLEIILKFHKIEIIGTAPDGNAALSVLEKTSCDIALVDLNMPYYKIGIPGCKNFGSHNLL